MDRAQVKTDAAINLSAARAESRSPSSRRLQLPGGHVLGNEFDQLMLLHRPGQPKALHLVAVKFPYQVKLTLGFNAFCHQTVAELLEKTGVYSPEQ